MPTRMVKVLSPALQGCISIMSSGRKFYRPSGPNAGTGCKKLSCARLAVIGRLAVRWLFCSLQPRTRPAQACARLQGYLTQGILRRKLLSGKEALEQRYGVPVSQHLAPQDAYSAATHLNRRRGFITC